MYTDIVLKKLKGHKIVKENVVNFVAAFLPVREGNPVSMSTYSTFYQLSKILSSEIPRMGDLLENRETFQEKVKTEWIPTFNQYLTKLQKHAHIDVTFHAALDALLNLSQAKDADFSIDPNVLYHADELQLI